MRVDDVLAELKPEHFTSGKVPSRTTVSDRLAGIGLKTDFVEAIADICSNDAAGRERLLGEVRSVKKRAATGDPSEEKPELQDRGGVLAAELVVVQKRSLEVSDKLMRALERAQELEMERNSANHMVLLLLTMVDKLQRDITALARERDRLRTSPSPRQTSLDHIRARLTKSEEQRTTAESELERARAERHKADRLAEEAAEQVRVLTEELDRLRAQVPDLSAETGPSSAPPSTLQEALDTDGADIDQALSKAARHLDDRAGRLDRLADEMKLDNPPDNPVASNEGPDNPVSAASLPRRQPSKPEPDNLVALSPADVVGIVQMLRMDNGRTLSDAPGTLRAAALSQPCGEMLETVSLLRTAGYDADGDHLLIYAGEHRPSEDVPVLIAGLRTDERSTDAYQLLTAVGQRRSPSEVVEIVSLLRLAHHDADAYQVLAAVGRARSGAGVVAVLDLVTGEDTSWVLAAARRDRHLKHIPSLVQALERAGRHGDAQVVSAAYAERFSDSLTPQAAGRQSTPTLGQRLHRDDDDDEDDEAEGDFHFRSYQIPGSPLIEEKAESVSAALLISYAKDVDRTRFLPIGKEFTSIAGEEVLKCLPLEQRRIASLRHRAMSIEQVSSELGYPHFFTQMLVADLLEAGILMLVADLLKSEILIPAEVDDEAPVGE
ncbi:hypothetical protein [Streptomyces sp. NBC_00347]|uniref:hypothetical protein n=1 Tax=Streptomyces sp. NBC_00347 TaxID=2975721 RepID=UPI00224F5439|nr:hypothetical protein [Streptomyces sp. NBC_00347]MCX5130014.1 hypothetical protein [Streptomyces sp. NBC_00347]